MLIVALAITGPATMMVGGCGGDDSSAVITESTAVSGAPSDTGAAAGGVDGQALAEEILGTFDELVGKVAELAAPKPEPATLAPQLEEVYASYEATMADLNSRYLVLRDADQTAFQDCNRFLSDNRPQHVTAKDDALSESVAYYNLELGDPEMVSLLSQRPVELLDVAVTQD
ncbi:MAG: hypothetical protein ACK2U9_20660 [Anaerolineae bacterium]